jgi:predicted ester cyclase
MTSDAGIGRRALLRGASLGLVGWGGRGVAMTGTVPTLVEAFYERIWNQGDLKAAGELLAVGFTFRGSLGAELRGIPAFLDYVRSVREPLAGYRCEILECVAEGDRAFAKMQFGGRHVGVFRGYPPTGKPVQWLGAALFRFESGVIADLWVLGDLASLEATLKANAPVR